MSSRCLLQWEEEGVNHAMMMKTNTIQHGEIRNSLTLTCFKAGNWGSEVIHLNFPFNIRAWRSFWPLQVGGNNTWETRRIVWCGWLLFFFMMNYCWGCGLAHVVFLLVSLLTSISSLGENDFNVYVKLLTARWSNCETQNTSLRITYHNHNY